MNITGKRETLVECSNLLCEMGRWYHLSCVGLTEDTKPDMYADWYCCQDCKVCDIIINRYHICNC